MILPMTGRRELSPKALFLVEVLAVAVSFTTYMLTLFVPALRAAIDQWNWRGGATLIIAVTFVGSFTVLFWANVKLRLGIRRERWADSELEPLRRWVSWNGVLLAAAIPIVLYFVLLILPHKHPLVGSFAVFALPFVVASGLWQVLQREKPTKLKGPLKAKPPHSDHWGE
jgi:hypothetical protein